METSICYQIEDYTHSLGLLSALRETHTLYKRESAIVYTVDLANPALEMTTKANGTRKIFFITVKMCKDVYFFKGVSHKQDVNETKSIINFALQKLCITTPSTAACNFQNVQQLKMKSSF